MVSGIRNKLFLSHLGVALVSILTLAWMANLLSSYSLSRYMESEQMSMVQRLVGQLAAEYQASIGNWTRHRESDRGGAWRPG